MHSLLPETQHVQLSGSDAKHTVALSVDALLLYRGCSSLYLSQSMHTKRQ